MQNLILSPVPLEQLKSELSDTIKKDIEKLLSLYQTPPQKENDFLTRKQAAALLGISLVTLGDWTKTGKVTGYRIASRVRYKRNELEKSLSQIQTFKVRR
jgi:excisionase family DNA binding protein